MSLKLRRKRGISAFLALIGLLLMSSGFAVLASAGTASAEAGGQPKFFVCKYVGTPGGTADHIISTASPSSPLGQFNDAHDSFTLAEDTGQEPPTLSDCPGAPVDECPEGTTGTPPNCVTPPELCPEGTDRAGEPVGDEPCDEVAPPQLCPEDSDHPERLADGSEGPCDDPAPELCPNGTDRAGEPVGDEPCDAQVEPPVDNPPTHKPPAHHPTTNPPAHHAATHAAPHKRSVVSAPRVPSQVEAGIVEDVSSTTQGLSLVGAGALLMMVGGLGMARRRGVLARG